jgi:hypothetical protein
MIQFRHQLTESDLFKVRSVDVISPSLLSDIIDRDGISTKDNWWKILGACVTWKDEYQTIDRSFRLSN